MVYGSSCGCFVVVGEYFFMGRPLGRGGSGCVGGGGGDSYLRFCFSKDSCDGSGLKTENYC